MRAMLAPAMVALFAGIIAGCLVTPDQSLWKTVADLGRDSGSAGDADGGTPADGPPEQSAPEGAPDLVVPPADQSPPDGASACSWTGTISFSIPVLLANVNSSATEIEPVLSADGMTLFFSSDRDGGSDVFSATRADTSSAFGVPTKDLDVSTPNESETRFALSHDGLEAFLAASWIDGYGESDIWIATRASINDPFTLESFQSSAVLNAATPEWDPFPSSDGLRLYYAIGDWPDGLGNTDIVVASRPSRQDPFSPPVGVEGVNSPQQESNAALTADELVIVFSSRRQGGPGNNDLYYALRTDPSAAFDPPQELPGINTIDVETEIFVTPDGCEIYFCSNRPGGQGGLDIYHSRLVP